MRARRSGFGAVELLVVAAILGFIIGMLLAGIEKARAAAKRIESSNNLRNIGFATQNYASEHNDELPPGCDEKGYSGFVPLLTHLELGGVEANLDTNKAPTDKANADVRKTFVKVFVSPRDPLAQNRQSPGTSYFFCAGPKPGMKDNTGAFAPGVKWTLGQISGLNGTSRTVTMGESLRGDGGTKAVTVKRQHVGLKKDALKELKDSSGVEDFKEGKNILADRGASWLEGRYLQTLFTGTRTPDDPRPDVDCEGAGGLSALRSLDGTIPLLFADNHVQNVRSNVDIKVWKAITDVKNKLAVDLP